MPLPDPKAGMVVNFRYLWSREQEQGQDEGRKDRPCLIVGVLGEGAERRVLLAPISHTPPHDAETAVEVPHETGQRIGLDDDRKWVMCAEMNISEWPGFDLMPRRGGTKTDDNRIFGHAPKALVTKAQRTLDQARQQNKLKMVSRLDGGLKI